MKLKRTLLAGATSVAMSCCLSAWAAPTVNLISPYFTPDQGWTIRGNISFAIKANDSQGIGKVEFYVDDKLVGTDTSYPYSLLWETGKLSTGAHTLKAVAYNTKGQSSGIQQSVTVAAPLTGSKTANGSVVKAGLLPNIQPAINNIRLRDTSAIRGGDGAYYLTGTGSDNNAWYHNEGVNLWRSTDLKSWNYVGLIWSFEGDGTAAERPWGELHGNPFRAVWAPEFVYLKGNYYFLWGYPGKGTKLMKSTTGKPEGPYVNNCADGGNLFGNIDGSLFEDNNGNVYLAYEYGAVVKLKPDLSGFDGKVNYVGGGDEGAFLFKRNNKYYLSAAKFMDNGRYSSYVGISDSPTGPFSQWHEAIPSGGHNTYFKDSEGNWWGTFFGNDNQAPWREKPSLLKMAFNSDGTMKPAADQSPPKSNAVVAQLAAAASQCNWYGSLWPLCTTTQSGWGWENEQSCIAVSTCSAQPAPWGVVGATSSSSSSKSSSSKPSSSSSSRAASSTPTTNGPAEPTGPLTGSIGTHDPSRMIESNGKYFVYSTGRGIPMKYSTDKLKWTSGPSVFPNGLPAWTRTAVPDNDGYDVWAPDIFYVNGLYHLYYSVSSWYGKKSAIGLVTSPTLDPNSSSYKWTDRGAVIATSTSTQTYTAIDAAPILDANGNPWLLFGSGYTVSWSTPSLMLIQLDKNTGKRITSNSPVYGLANGHLEGSYLHYRNGYYYMFYNDGSCCSGTSSTYKIHMLRSKTITGPYLDKSGNANGSNNLFMQSSNGLYGPGHMGILSKNGNDYFTYHYYNSSGSPVLGQGRLIWGSDGWPKPGN